MSREEKREPLTAGSETLPFRYRSRLTSNPPQPTTARFQSGHKPAARQRFHSAEAVVQAQPERQNCPALKFGTNAAGTLLPATSASAFTYTLA